MYDNVRGRKQMLLLAHPGITLGAAIICKAILTRSLPLQPNTNVPMKYSEPNQKAPPFKKAPASGRASLLTFFQRIDVRLLLIGSLLPDIVDKPLGTYFLRDSLSSGKIFCHTLVFLLVITLTGLYLYRGHGKIWLLTLSFGTFTHLICDQMWGNLHTLLWPAYGFAFKRDEISHWIQNILYGLHSDPRIYVPELIGMLILIWFALTLMHRRKFQALLRNGQVL